MTPQEMFPRSFARLRRMEAEVLGFLAGEADETTAPMSVDLATLIPGGIKPADHWYIHAADADCSRCRGPISRYETPLTLWFALGDRMLIYCTRCTGGQIEALTIPAVHNLHSPDVLGGSAPASGPLGRPPLTRKP